MNLVPGLAIPVQFLSHESCAHIKIFSIRFIPSIGWSVSNFLNSNLKIVIPVNTEPSRKDWIPDQVRNDKIAKAFPKRVLRNFFLPTRGHGFFDRSGMPASFLTIFFRDSMSYWS